MWYFNYCAPFLNTIKIVNNIRYAMLAELLLLYIGYITISALYKFQCLQNKVIQNKQHGDGGPKSKQNMKNSSEQDQTNFQKKKKQYSIFGKPFMNKHQFKNYFTLIFGHHAIAVSGCIMYSPYIPQIILCYLYFISCIILIFMELFKIRLGTKIAIFFLMIINIILMFSLTIGVGASGYDSNNLVCYLT